MSALATYRPWLSRLLIVCVCLLGSAPPASAQVDPAWDHYKVYLGFHSMPSRSVILTDQFRRDSVSTNFLDSFANPTEKLLPGGISYPIHDPRLHYAWWLLDNRPVSITVAVSNQFGDQMLNLNRLTYLLNPALKNETGTLPVQNHYKCYNCTGSSVNRQVTLTDQFGVWQTTATTPHYFCNPTEKRIPGGATYPIIDPNQHYVCYDLNPVDGRPFSATFKDQFTSNASLQFIQGYFLCVPTAKVEPTPARGATWGRLKVLYR